MRITEKKLKQIIKEEVARALLEAEVINADSGEILTLPPELEGEYDDGEELPSSAFEALRKEIDALRPVTSKKWYEEDEDDLDAPWSDEERRVSRQVRDELSADRAEAVERLMLLAREAADDWMADNPAGDIADVAYDLADGLRWSSEGDDWADAIDHFGSKADLVSALTEEMAG